MFVFGVPMFGTGPIGAPGPSELLAPESTGSRNVAANEKVNS